MFSLMLKIVKYYFTTTTHWQYLCHVNQYYSRCLHFHEKKKNKNIIIKFSE